MPIDPSQLIHRLRSLAPFDDDDAARRARDATLTALRRGLSDDDADWLALDLGPELAEPLVRGAHTGDVELDAFYRCVARLAGVRRGVAREQAQVVCRVLAELVSASTVARLQRSLPQLAVLFTFPEPEPPASEPEHLREDRAPDHTLAGGQPGSDRPLCDARPPSAVDLPTDSAPRGHAQSIAISDDPHGDSKLSSARGLSQEREGRSLATWRRSVETR
ncbi:MAG TPA: DUF2267 domain-containing protein [Polyangiaceae bacterium]|nr:DUF2267 domain-containing protein [Polyangiaceae bacterium]